MQGQGGGALTWSVAVHWVCTGPGVSWVVRAKVSPHLCFAQGHTACAIKPSEMAATLLDLEIPRHNQAVNLVWLLLVPGLGLTEASCCLFEKI